MIFGYARVSKEDQNIFLQIDALRNYGVDEIFEEKISGRHQRRPKLQELLSKLRAGDTLVIWRLDRLGRTAKQLISLAEDFEKNGIRFVSLKENLDTTTAARARGRHGGRPAPDKKKLEKARKMYESQKFSVREIAETVGISVTTFYKYIHHQSTSKAQSLRKDAETDGRQGRQTEENRQPTESS